MNTRSKSKAENATVKDGTKTKAEKTGSSSMKDVGPKDKVKINPKPDEAKKEKIHKNAKGVTKKASTAVKIPRASTKLILENIEQRNE